jgi:nitrate/nitrite-specific signal transduction histidine kinase
MDDDALYWPKSLAELRGLDDDTLISRYDALLSDGRYVARPDDYLAELQRREAERSTATMTKLTWTIAAMTLVNMAFVIWSAVR